jgi:hypothetical protein
MFSFVVYNVPIVLSVVPCVWVFLNVRFAWLELLLLAAAVVMMYFMEFICSLTSWRWVG